MERRTLGAIAIGIIVLMVIVVFVGMASGGLDREVLRSYEEEQRALEQSKSQLDTAEAAIERLLAENSSLSSIADRENWTGVIAEAREGIRSAGAKLDAEGRPLADQNERNDTPKLAAVVSEISGQRSAAVATVSRLERRAEQLVNFFNNRDRFVAEAAQNAEALRDLDLTTIETKAKKGQSDWPEKADALAKRVAFVVEGVARGPILAQEIQVQGTKPLSEVDPDVVLPMIEELARLRTTTRQEIDALSKLIDELYVSYDKILVDMEIREGSVVEFYHRYKVIEVDAADQVNTDDRWELVSKAVYEKHKNQLGMTLESKPKGVFNHEATTIVSPPGYSYVGNRHYGQWENRGGGRFWVWYGQYAFMRDLLWGPRYYQPVPYGRWNTYSRYRDSGRVYYGDDGQGRQRYGSGGSYTGSRYQTSKYVKSSGFKDSRYVKSGGSYRGSKYASRSAGSGTRSSASSYRRGSRSWGGSRSFGK